MGKKELNGLVGKVVIRKKDKAVANVTGMVDGKFVIVLQETGEEKQVSASTMERHWQATEEEIQEDNMKENKGKDTEAKEEEFVETEEERKAREAQEAIKKAERLKKAKEEKAKAKEIFQAGLREIYKRIMDAVTKFEGITHSADKKYDHLKVGSTGFFDIALLAKAVDFAVCDIDGISEDFKGFEFKRGPKTWKVGWSAKVTADEQVEAVLEIAKMAYDVAVKIEAEKDQAQKKAEADKEAKKAEAKAKKEAEKAEAKAKKEAEAEAKKAEEGTEEA